MNKIIIPVIASILILGTLGLSQNAFAPPPTTSMTFGPDSDDLWVSDVDNEWVLDADTGIATHTRLIGKNAPQTNNISIASFLEVWYDATGKSPVTSYNLVAYDCLSLGVTTWITSTDMVTRFVSYDDGLVISFEAPDDGVQSGEVGYAIQGQNFETDWSAGHVQFRAFELEPLIGTGVYSLEWTHVITTFPTSSGFGTISEGTETVLLLNTDSMIGEHSATNCAAALGTVDAFNPTPIFWVVDTLDIKQASSPQEAIQNVSAVLNDIITNSAGTPLADKAQDAFDKLQTALNELNKEPPDNQAAVGNIEGAVGDLEAAVKDGLLDSTAGAELMDDLAGVARQLAADAIDNAIADPASDQGEISDAEQSLADGDALRGSGDFKDAVNKYKDALARAESALP